MVTAKLISVFVFAYAKIPFSHDEAHIRVVENKNAAVQTAQIHKPIYGFDVLVWNEYFFHKRDLFFRTAEFRRDSHSYTVDQRGRECYISNLVQ